MTTINASNFAYVQFCHALIKKCHELGIQIERAETESGLPQNEGWCFLRSAPGAAALIIPKGKGRLGSLHSHVDLAGKDGYIPLPKKNGKVVCHFEPALEKVVAVLPMFVGAAKRATAVPTPKQPVAAAPAPLPVASQPDDYGAKELASWSASEEEELERLIAAQA